MTTHYTVMGSYSCAHYVPKQTCGQRYLALIIYVTHVPSLAYGLSVEHIEADRRDSQITDSR